MLIVGTTQLIDVTLVGRKNNYVHVTNTCMVIAAGVSLLQFRLSVHLPPSVLTGLDGHNTQEIEI